MITTVNQKDYIGKHLTWSEAIQLFSGKWVVFSNYTKKYTTITEGTLEAVLEDNQKVQYDIEHFNEDLYIARTSETINMEVINGVLHNKVTC